MGKIMAKKTKSDEFNETCEALVKSYKSHMADFRKGAEKRLANIEERINKSLKILESSNLFFNSVIKKNEEQIRKCKSQIEDFEESLLYIMHNIKKNQFLYSHYPEEWVKNYLDIKKGLVEENKFMEEKEAVNG